MPAWKCGNSHREMVLLEGNLCNLEGKFIILMDISVFFLQKMSENVNEFTFLKDLFAISF